MINYKSAFIETTPVANDDNNAILELPFRTYHQTIVSENICYYSQLSNTLIGKECLVYIHYAEEDETAVFEYAGFLGVDWNTVQTDSKALAQWSIKKEDALATSTGFGEEAIITKYTGLDATKIIHPYQADDVREI